MSTKKKCKSIDDKNHLGRRIIKEEEKKKLSTSLTKLKNRLPVTSVRGTDEGEIHLEKMNKQVEGKG